MARQPSSRAPFPISVRTSSMNAYTTQGERSPPKGDMDLYHALVPESPPSLHELRVRASSPLLGQNYRAKQPSYVPIPPETQQIRKSGSWSELHSVPNAQRSAFQPKSQENIAYNDIDNSSRGNPGPDETSQKRDQPKDPKRKTRPSRIDLSLLFPKPKSTAAPLLSPQRYTNSPSPVASEYSSAKTKKFDRTSSVANRLTKAPPRSRSNSRKQMEARIPEDAPLPPMPAERKVVDWFDAPVEKVIRCAEEGDELSEMDGQPQDPSSIASPSSERRQSKDLGSQSEKSLQQRTAHSKSSDDTARKVSSNASSTSRSAETHLSPKPMKPFSNRIRSSLQAWQSEPDVRLSSSTKKAVSKKASSNTLATSDLTKCSVLYLSSSEDEDEDDEEPAKQDASRSDLRDSVATYDDFEPEICTAEAVMATKGPTLTRLDKRHSVSSAGSRGASKGQSRSRNLSLSSSTAKSSNSAKKRESRGSAGIPVISEPDDFHEGIVPRRQSLYSNSSSGNRRSRIIAVTRQEESWLEAMRQRNGRITPSLFQELQQNTSDSETGSALLSPPPPRSHDSFHNTDTSFLRLSMGFPSPQGTATPADQGATSKEKEGSVSLGAASDTEQRNDNSNLSPRVSLVYSDTHSSPSTTGHASPLTPTLPIHRFSPQGPPPSFSPPAAPEPPRRHSRRRTDSSEAIVLNESENTKRQEPEYPLWAVKWNRDSADLAIVH
ncbi:hypothetical protein T310_2941 [Rasamsonia emersonii CBS 393.64]|uniref:Uncharacterized protein n=1 Tax=Rasamsonia emersonii (strain ATCC 16479 / CBS 393.64 / IMI 116815) TaxID=1408163 RepID=A0A0F4YXM7_RASE3|nr:hypothetical protein T310_2941 [Rasamsonia emersonii CBS 393.64]KKA23062.1 hypothetical protein T310_2941 [Rasamsonia emersonii CBS 393.64]